MAFVIWNPDWETGIELIGHIIEHDRRTAQHPIWFNPGFEGQAVTGTSLWSSGRVA